MKHWIYFLLFIGTAASAQTPPASSSVISVTFTAVNEIKTVDYKGEKEIKIRITGLSDELTSLTFKQETGALESFTAPVSFSAGTAVLNDNSVGPTALLFGKINALSRAALTSSPQSLAATFSANAGALGTLKLVLKFTPKPGTPGDNGSNSGGAVLTDVLKPTGFIIPDALKLSDLLSHGSSTDAQKFSKRVKDFYGINASTPFFSEFPPDPPVVVEMTGAEKGSIFSNAISAAGGLDVTKFVDGLAIFLVKRTKEELNVAFFERFRDLLQEPRYKDLKLVFPQTNQTLLALGEEVYNYDAYLTSLRTSFEKDLRALPPHLSRWVDEGTFKTYFDGKPYLKSGLKSSLYFYDELSNGTHPGKAIENFPLTHVSGVIIPLTITESIRIDSLTKVFIGISKSLRSGKGDHYWVTPDTIKSLVDDVKARRFYLAMLFEDALKLAKNLKNKDSLGYEFYSRFFDEFTQTAESGHELVLKLIFNKDEPDPNSKFTKTVEVLRNVSELGLDVSRRKYGAAIVHAVQVYNYLTGDATLLDELVAIGSIKELSTKEVKFQWSDQPDVLITNMLNSGIKAVWSPVSKQLGFQLPNEDETTIHKFAYPHTKNDLITALNKIIIDKDSLKASNPVADEIQFDLPRNHRKRVVSTVESISVENKAQDIVGKLFTYGSFIAAVAEAKNSQEVADAIEAFALPAGSSSIKRKSAFNVALNGYTGVLAGHEIHGPSPYFNSYAVWAPVGVTASWGRINFGNWQNHSISVFASIIDIGAVTAFRFTNEVKAAEDTTKTTPGTASLQKIRLKDIIAPGLAVSWGIAKTPLSLTFGWQSAPFLRKVTADANTTLDYRASRIYLTLAVDIPILNFYNRKNWRR
jgi:hypothetical protein